jgi:hypothetical protein
MIRFVAPTAPTGISGGRWLVVAALWFSCLAVEARALSTAVADTPHAGLSPGQLWCISSRRAAWGADESIPTLDYWRYNPSQRAWAASGLEEFLAADDPHVPTCIFVHGNRIGRDEAFDIGWRAYCSFAAHALHGARFRFVVWTWPSDPIPGLLKDIRVKAARAEAHAVYLAWLVDQMNPRVPVSLLGYSFGARLTAGSLHLLGGGTLGGRQLAVRTHPDRLPLRAVLMAGALDNSALLPQSHNGRALSQVDRMLVMINPADKALRFYRLLYGLQAHKAAIGATGAAGLDGIAQTGKVSHWNVARWVGPEHDWTRYLLTPAIVSGMRQYWLYAGDEGGEAAPRSAYHKGAATSAAQPLPAQD